MSRYRWIVFDADGTLFDYKRSELNALRNTFRQYGLEFDETIHQAFARINSRLWSEFERGRISSAQLRVRRFEELAAKIKSNFSAPGFSADYLWNLGGECTLLPGALDVVRRLSSNFGLVLATNGIAEVQRRRFIASGINGNFASIIISDEIGVAKPDPRYFEKVFVTIGNPEKHAVLMVGDGLSSDIAGGGAYGIDTCWYNPAGCRNKTSVEPTYQIRNLIEILEIVRECGKPDTYG